MNDKNTHHIIESIDQLLHNFMNDSWIESPLSDFHKFFQIASVAKFHKYVISCVGFDGFSHSANIFAGNSILILDFGNYKAFFCLAQILTFDYFTSIELRVRHRFKCRELIFSFNYRITTTWSRIFRFQKWWLFWNFLRQINFTILTLSKVSI
jgi:hypothetical protein